MFYASNGNIMSKTGIGDYEYSSAKPHAVEAVDNTSGLIPEGTQSVTYNLWGKVSEVNAVVGSDTYRYELTYGPDLQRVLAVLWKNNSLVHLVTYGRDYEEKYVGSDITRYYYVNGTDGNAAVYTSNSSGSKAYCMDMDHLGSIIGLYDQYGTKCYGASFDPWGKRTLMGGSIEFDRGFTGHEHIDEINLIDMNGRMYDPLLGRFLSSDPFVQAPTNPQNFNRYSYCLNNPFKYTDPDGEIFWEAVLIGAAIFGAGNTIAHGIQGDINNWKDGFKYFSQGAIAGAALGATWYLAPSIPVFGNVLQSYMTWSFKCKLTMTAVSAVSGVARGLCTNDWNGLLNSAELFLGNFYIDENAGFLEGVWQGYSRQSWESLQTGFGHTVNQVVNTFGGVKTVRYGYGVTVAESVFKNWGGFTIGCFIHGELGIRVRPDDPNFQHEYGHYLQSRAHGPFYAIDAIRSFYNAANNPYSMDSDIEINANRRAFWYFYNTVPKFGQRDKDGFIQSDMWKWEENPLEKRLEGGNHNHRYKF